MKRMIATAALAVVALASIAATPAQRRNWSLVVAETGEGGHAIGNPAAKVKVVEYASYTCPHCAQFEMQGGAALQVGYVQRGNVSFEVRNLVRDPVDLTIALLTNCGAPSKFLLNHSLFMRSQPAWMKIAQGVSAGQQKRWNEGPMAKRLRAIAGDLKFYDAIARRGYSRIEAEQCLNDQAMTSRLMAVREESAKLGVTGTPSFFINGELMPSIHDWKELDTTLREKLAAGS